MKSMITIILSLCFMLSLSIPALAVEKPKYVSDYTCPEGGFDKEAIFFGGMSGNYWYLVDAVFGEGTYRKYKTELEDSWLEAAGADLDDPDFDNADVDEEIYDEVYEKYMLPYRKIEPTYNAVKEFGITKEQFTEANKTLPDEIRYTDEEIELIYGGDLHALMEYSKSPLSFVYGEDIYCFSEVMSLDFEKQLAMNEHGEFAAYLAEMNEKVKLIGTAPAGDDYAVSDVAYEWLEYTTYNFETYANAKAPSTGDKGLWLAVGSAAGLLTLKALKKGRGLDFPCHLRHLNEKRGAPAANDAGAPAICEHTITHRTKNTIKIQQNLQLYLAFFGFLQYTVYIKYSAKGGKEQEKSCG